jgi:hypothetical protein
MPTFAPVWLKQSFWMESVKMHKYVEPFHGASPTRGDLALTWGFGIIFMFVPLSFYDHEALPAEGWQRGLFSLINLYLAASAITMVTDDTDAYWSSASKKWRQAYIVFNGIAMVLLIAVLPGAALPAIVTYVLATLTAVCTASCPKKLIKPIAVSGLSFSVAMAISFGASSAALPACIMYIVLICSSFSPEKNEGIPLTMSMK